MSNNSYYFWGLPLVMLLLATSFKVYGLENRLERLHHSIGDVQTDLNTLKKEIKIKRGSTYDQAI